MGVRSPRARRPPLAAGWIAAMFSIPILTACPGVTAQEEDVWKPGHRLVTWRAIDPLQQYPAVQTAPRPDLAERSRDPDRLVRAAACLAIGRGAHANDLPWLVERLDDHSPLVRRCALWALLQINSPTVKRPLLDVLGNWTGIEEWNYELPGLTYAEHLPRLGLPSDLLNNNTLREERRQWLADFDAEAWRIPPGGYPTHAYAHQPLLFHAGIEHAEIDGGEALVVTVQQAAGDRASYEYYDPMLSADRLIAANDLPSEKSNYRGGIGSAEGEIVVERKTPTAESGRRGYQLTLKTDALNLSPGVYLIHLSQTTSPLLIRVRRSPAAEAKLGALLDQIPTAAAVEELERLRVQAAVKSLIETFRKNAGGNNFAVSKALAEIGDPAAAAVLLEHPRMVAYDSGGDTTPDLLTMGEAAWPACKRQVLAWKESLADEQIRSLAIALRVLEEDASATVADLRWEIVRALEEEGVDFAAAEEYEKMRVLSVALLPCSESDPKRFVEAVWTFHDRLKTFASLLHAWRRDRANPAQQSDDDWIDQELRRRILTLPPDERVGPLAALAKRFAVTSRGVAQNAFPQGAGAEFQRTNFHASAELDVKPQVAESCLFTLDELRRLNRWDIFTAQKTQITALPNPVRAVARVDRRRAFVAFEHGTVALYEVGRNRPVWERALALGGEPGLSAAPDAIVAADEVGALHVLAPETGEVLWTATVEPAPYCGYVGVRRTVLQTSDRILLIDPVGSPGCVASFDRETGQTQWSIPLRSSVPCAAAGADLLLAADTRGQVAAVDVSDGRLRWRRSFTVSTPNWPRISLTTPQPQGRIYIAAEDAVYALDSTTGQTQWTWKWRPREDDAQLESQPSPTLAMGRQGVYCVFNWSQNGVTHGDRVDVVLLDESGRARLHQASPSEQLFQSIPSPAENIFVADDALYFRRCGF